MHANGNNARLKTNETLSKVYLLKEELRLTFWDQRKKGDARTLIEGWIEKAKSLNL